MIDIKTIFLLALVIRVICVIYSIIHDSMFNVKFTDVDYLVFSDAASFVAAGESPYRRATYRYTPLLAYLLLPNVYVTPLFGKLLFILCDILVGYFILKLVSYRCDSASLRNFCVLTWVFNPLTITVSSRGNAESLIAAVVLGSLYFLQTGSQWAGFVLHALAVHMKIYPILFIPAVYFHLRLPNWKDSNKKPKSNKQNPTAVTSLQDSLATLLYPTQARLSYGAVGILVNALLLATFYYRFGWEFLQETYLYHVTRQDTRHNFSPLFYMFYLLGDGDYTPLIATLAFIPQVLLCLAVSVLFYRDLPYACALQTLIFVTFNKVCTSQYFLWYLSLLPLVLPSIRISGVKAIVMTAAWGTCQAVWLLPAYLLEFQGVNTFIAIWLAGLLFYAANVWIVYELINAYVTTSHVSKAVEPSSKLGVKTRSRTLQ